MTTNRAITSRPAILSTSYPWLIVSVGMLFYCYNYLLRVSPSFMQAELTDAFHITAMQFGALASMYYWVYTLMQIPAGLLYDIFGVRLTLCFACLIAVLGLGVFINAETLALAGVGRLLIGFGCAFAYIGTLKLASLWFTENRFATVAGLTTAVGMATGALAQKYLTPFVETVGYQQALQSSLFAGIALSILIFVIIRNKPKLARNEKSMNIKQLGRALVLMSKNKQMWLIGVIGCLLYLPASVFLDLWGIPYLKTVYHLTGVQAAEINDWTFYGWIISGPIIGMLSDKIKRRRLPLSITGFFAAALLCLVFYYPHIQSEFLKPLFFIVGFCCGAHPLCFALGKENNPLEMSGTAVAATNTLIMLGGVIFQPLVGQLLDMHSQAIGANGLPIYSAADYNFALAVIPIGVAIGIFLSFFLKETYCESRTRTEGKALFD